MVGSFCAVYVVQFSLFVKVCFLSNSCIINKCNRFVCCCCCVIVNVVVVVDKQMIQVCVELLPLCPVLLLSKPDAKEDVILGVAYMPKVSRVIFFLIAAVCNNQKPCN